MLRPRFCAFVPVPILLLLLFFAWRPGTNSQPDLAQRLRQTWTFVLPYNQTVASHSVVNGSSDSSKTKPFTTAPSCPTSDGHFFLSRHNFTYQIQCATRYNAETLTFDEIVIDLQACINQCDTYNHNPSEEADYCVGATFFEVPVSRMGSCTTHSEIEGVRTGGIIPMTQQSVLLIGGPGGMVAAELRPGK